MYQFSIALDSRSSDCHGIANWEVTDGWFGAPLSRMDGNQVEDIRDLLIRKLARIVLYTVDMPVSDRQAYVRFFRNAHVIGVENVKLAYAAFADESEESLRQVLAIAEAFSIKVLFELEADHRDTFGFDQYAKFRGDNVGLIFNPNEFLKCGIQPYGGILSKTKYAGDIVFLRVCDMEEKGWNPVLPEKGNSQIKECASKLLARSFSGYFAFSAYGENIAMGDAIHAFTEALVNM